MSADEIADISSRLETLRETNARRKTEARTSQIEALERRLWQLENPGATHPEADAAPSSPAPQACVQPDPEEEEELSVISRAARPRAPSSARTCWEISSDAPSAPTVVMWDLNHALVPHYQLKRLESGPELFDGWSTFSEQVQRRLGSSVQGQSTRGLSQRQTVADVYNTCAADLVDHSETLCQLEQDSDYALDGQLSAVKEALAYVTRRGGCNAVVTSASLKSTLSKLVVFGLAPHIPMDLVFSAENDDKGKLMAKAFREARSTIGGSNAGARYILASKAGRSDTELARLCGATHVPIVSHTDLGALKDAVDGNSN